MNSIIIKIIIVWLFFNMLFPIFLRSIERQYEGVIDLIVRWFIFLIKALLRRLLQLSLLIIALPAIIMSFILEKTLKKFKIKRGTFIYAEAETFIDLRKAILEKDFPATFAKGFNLLVESIKEKKNPFL